MNKAETQNCLVTLEYAQNILAIRQDLNSGLPDNRQQLKLNLLASFAASRDLDSRLRCLAALYWDRYKVARSQQEAESKHPGWPNLLAELLEQTVSYGGEDGLFAAISKQGREVLVDLLKNVRLLETLLSEIENRPQ